MALKSDRIDLRVTPKEKESLVVAAAAAGVSVASYLLYCAGLKVGDLVADKIIKYRSSGSGSGSESQSDS